MEDLGISGWELASLSEDAQVLTEQWINALENRDRAISTRVHELKQQALIHKELLI
jgi:polysaccharide pyruvyl transferase WcaK-like protein